MPERKESDMTFTPVEHAVIAHACEDYAGNWYGAQPSGITFSRYDCERYVTEGELGDLINPYKGSHKFAEVWEQVKVYLDAHPEILAAGRLSDTQRAERQAARDAAARALFDKASDAFEAGRYDDALELIDRAEVTSPAMSDGRPVPGPMGWESYRRAIRTKMAEAEMTVGG